MQRSPVAVALVALAAFCCLQSAAAISASFDHGVASGDPLPDRMVIWTRLTPRANRTRFFVTYKVSPDRTFVSNETVIGTYTTTADRDFTVKVDVQDLTPGTKYYYQFYVSDNKVPASITHSPMGRFTTPYPAGVAKQQQLKYGVFSCSNWGWGFFNAYDAAAKFELDFWVHLGDYFYEYGVMRYPAPEEAVRFQEAPWGIEPKDEIVTLEDYRTRHSLYRQDPGLQALSASAPLIAMWDDHEITNNARRDSAQNHQEDEGEYEERKRVSIKAYHEWMPTRDRDLFTNEYVGPKYNRSFQFGELATFIMTEARLTARSDELLPPIAANVTEIVGDKNPDEWTEADKQALMDLKAQGAALAAQPNYTLLGVEQLAWIEEETKKSVEANVTWQLYGHGTVMLDSYLPDFEKAIELKAEKQPAVAAAWQDAYRRVAYFNGTNTTTRSYGVSCHNQPYYGRPLDVTPDMRASVRTNQALGQYLITSYFDAWPGFQAEKEEFLRIVSMANNAAQYGGDSHADWAGIQTYNGTAVLGEFDVGGVTSPSYENNAILPVPLINDAMVAAAYDTGMRHAYAGRKGFLLVTLDAKVHHGEYIHATHCAQNYRAQCDVAWDWFAAPNNNGDLVKSTCSNETATPFTNAYSTSNGFYNTMYPYIGQQGSVLP